MRWPWKRPNPDRQGLEDARRTLAKARADEPRIARIVREHKQRQEENHFAEKFQKAMEA